MHNYLGIETGLSLQPNLDPWRHGADDQTAGLLIAILVRLRQTTPEIGQQPAGRCQVRLAGLSWASSLRCGAIGVLRHFNWRAKVPYTDLIAKPETTDVIRLQGRVGRPDTTHSSRATVAFAASWGRLDRESMKQRNIIQGGRAELERELLEALFTSGAEVSVHDLKTRLVPRGQGKLRLIVDGTHEHASPEIGSHPDPSKN